MKKISDFKIYNEFDEHLMKEWQKLWNLLKGNYNLSPEWCSIWFKYFGNKNKKLFIYTAWENDELKLVAPFYLKDKVLYLIGSKPDFHDEFDILSTSSQYTQKLVEDILDKELKVDFRLVNSENDFIKYFLREIENNKNFSKKIYYSTLKLQANSSFEFKKSFCQLIKKRTKRSINEHNQKLSFEYETSKDSDFFEEMLFLHKKRWPLFKSKEKELFIKDIYYNTDLLLLSRLSDENTGNSISFQLSYKYFDRLLASTLVFNPAFKTISPSLILFYNFINEGFKRNYSVIDLGVGAMRYKYDLSNSQSIILSLETDSSILRKNDFIYSTLKGLKATFVSLFIQ